MRIITTQALAQDPLLLQEIIKVLKEDGLVCFPFRRQYSIVASLTSPDAVLRLVQSKRRASKAPSLVLIPDRDSLSQVVESVPPAAGPLMNAFWPGTLTLLFTPNPDLPSKVLKTIAAKKKDARIGVRVPAPGLALDLVRAFGGPLLTSSANISQKGGSSSVSAIRKEFHHTVDILIESGDMPQAAPSTIVDLDGGKVQVHREGPITLSEILAVLQKAGIAAE
jgi:L-threonylcarbamoyladenylate synthase